MAKSKKSTSDQTRAKRVIEFLSLGFKDYIGARILLLNHLPLQGATLGSSAVEKYIKAILSIRGERSEDHLNSAQLKSLKNYVPDLANKLNFDFLVFLRNCYKLRYTDTLPPDFNVTIYARETLAELDHTIFSMEFQVNVRKSDSTEITTRYRGVLKSKDPRLLNENHVLNQQDKTDFLKKPDTGYEIRNRPGFGLLEVEFRVFESPLDGKFCREALRPQSGNNSFVIKEP